MSTRCRAHTNSFNQKSNVCTTKYKVRAQDAGWRPSHNRHHLHPSHPGCLLRWRLVLRQGLKLKTKKRRTKLKKTWTPSSLKGCRGANSDNFSHHRSAGRHQRGRTCHQTMGVRGFFWGRIINFWGWIIIIIWGKDNCFKLTSGRTGTAQGPAKTRWTGGTVMSMAGRDNWPNYNHNKEPEKRVE